MSTSIKKYSGFSLATVTQTRSEICKAYISVDLHTKHSVADQAVFELLGELLLSGTKSHTRESLLDAINSLGGDVTISVVDGVITVQVTSRKQVWEELLGIFNQILTEPTFTAHEIKRVKKLAHNALHDQKENTKQLAVDNLQNALYKKGDRHTTVSIDTLQKAVAAVSKKELVQMHQHLLQQQWTASVTGSKSACARFTKTVTAIKSSESNTSSPTLTNYSAQPKSRLLLKDVPSKQNIDLSIGCHVPIGIRDEQFPALQFGIAVLAKWGGFAGRLMSTVREKEGLTYSIYGRLEGLYFNELGYFRIMTFFSPDQTIQGLTSTFREISTLHKKGITQKEFESFKTILETQTVLRNDSPFKQLEVTHTYHQLGFSVEEITQFEISLQKVTKAEINAAIKTFLDPSKMVVSAAGPIQGVKKDLKAFIKTV